MSMILPPRYRPDVLSYHKFGVFESFLKNLSARKKIKKFTKYMLTILYSSDNIFNCERHKRRVAKQAAVAQSVERRLGKAEVTGSIPVSSFIFLP